MPHKPAMSGLALALVAVLAAGAMVSTASAAGMVGQDPDRPTADTRAAGTEQASPSLNRSVRRLLSIARNSRIGGLVAGRTVNVYVELENGSTATWGAKFDRDGSVAAVTRGGFPDRDLDVRTSEAAIRSIVASNASGLAARKALAYDLITVEGVGSTTGLAADVGSGAAARAGRPRTAAVRVDVDGDGRVDGILDIEGRDTDDDAALDRKITTVLRDTDDDGEMDTISTDAGAVTPAITGVARLDTNDDDAEDTVLRVKGTDTDADGRFDTRTATKLADTTGNGRFDLFSETVERIPSTKAVESRWDLTDDDVTDVRVVVEGTDTDGDGRYDRKTTTVFLNLDDDATFETSSRTTAETTPTLRMSAEFDTDGDGTADAKAEFEAADANGDGTMETKRTSVVNDSDDDGEYDRVVSRRECRRGFLRRSVCQFGWGSDPGGILWVLTEPRNLSRIGAVASILGTVIQLQRGQ